MVRFLENYFILPDQLSKGLLGGITVVFNIFCYCSVGILSSLCNVPRITRFSTLPAAGSTDFSWLCVKASDIFLSASPGLLFSPHHIRSSHTCPIEEFYENSKVILDGFLRSSFSVQLSSVFCTVNHSHIDFSKFPSCCLQLMEMAELRLYSSSLTHRLETKSLQAVK